MSLRTGVVGHGNIGSWHAYLAHKLPNSGVVAICDQDEERLDDVDERLGAETYTDLVEMLDRESIDSLHVCTPPQTHLPIASEAMNRDIHTLIEKPLAGDTDDSEQLVELAAETDIVSSVVHHKLFEPVMRKASSYIEQGAIGDVVSTTMLFSENRNLDETPRGNWVYDLPGGEIGEGLAHQVYVALAFSDGLGEIRNVAKQRIGEYSQPIDFDGVTIEITDKSNNQLIDIKALANSVDQDMLYVHGTEGVLRVDREAMTTTVDSLTGSSSIQQTIASGGKRAANKIENKIRSAMSPITLKLGYGSFYSGHYRQMELYQDSIQNNKNPPVTLSEGHDTVRVIDALRAQKTSAGQSSGI